MSSEASELTLRGANLELRSRVVPVLILVAVIMGILLRVAVFLISSRSGTALWSAGNDESAFILLARNVVNHQGLSFAGKLSAYRPPLYPLLLSVAMRISSHQWLVLIRLLQFFSALLTAWACGELARQWGGSRQISVGLALWMPTLVFFQPEIGTETLAVMMTALWFVCLVYMRAPWSPALIGVVAGIAALLRFNTAPLIFFGPLVLLYYLRDWKRPCLALSIGVIILSPWIIRNWLDFGRPILSTDTGYAMAVGIIAPTARTQAGDTDATHAAIGWVNQDIESNDAPANMRDEMKLDRQAMSFVLLHWREIPGTWPTKLAAFWLSWDQWSAISGVSRLGQVVRRVSVLIYWVVLCAALVAGWRLWRRIPYIIVYAVLMTLLHLPLPMSTRLRVPLMEPVIIALAACAISTRNYPTNAPIAVG
jgi:hypothetical protein